MSGGSLYQRNIEYFRKQSGYLGTDKEKASGRYHTYPARVEGMFYIESADEGSLLLHSRFNPLLR